MFYDEDTVTDQPQRQIVAEVIREKALHALDAEIPHGIAVAKILSIISSVFCPRSAEQGIISAKSQILRYVSIAGRISGQKSYGGY